MLQEHPESINTDELPIVVDEDPHSTTKIVEIECGNCGYDRGKEMRDRYTGLRSTTCMLCEHRRKDDGSGWIRPTTDSDRITDLRRHANVDGPLHKAGEYGPRSRYSHGDGEVYRYTDGTSLIKWVEHPPHGRTGTSTVHSITDDDLRGIVSTLEDDCGWLSELVREKYDSAIVDCADNKNPRAIHHGRAKTKYDDERQWRATRAHVSALHLFENVDLRPITFSPQDNGIVV
jgi:hypothetical protein